jgi:hypothetical protein
MNKLKFYLLGICVLVVFILFLIIIIFSSSISSNKIAGPLPTVTPYSTPNDLAEKRLLLKLEHPSILSTNDAAVKTHILSFLNGQPGDLYHGPDVIISYLPAGKEFQGEILTTNIDLAKKEAVDWFTTQGMSKQGICDLPIMFFLGANASAQFQNPNVLFSPLPPGC